jgi:hypothetical protein
LCIAGGLTAAFMGAATADADAARSHHHKPAGHALTAQAHVFLPPAKPGEHVLYYYVASHHFDLNGHIYEGGSGQKQGYNNSAYECKSNIGPVPRGEFRLTEREKPFFGQRAWRILGTPCHRTGILVHSDRVGVAGRPQGETKGCAGVKAALWPQFVKEMDSYKPTRIIVMP